MFLHSGRGNSSGFGFPGPGFKFSCILDAGIRADLAFQGLDLNFPAFWTREFERIWLSRAWILIPADLNSKFCFISFS
jgi:hypothetical protein